MCNLDRSVPEQKINTDIGMEFYFPTPIYMIDRPDFLIAMNVISEEYLQKERDKGPLNDIYPLYMSGNYMNDPRAESFARTVGTMGWNILDNQGYDVRNFEIFFTEMWTQEHHKNSFMEQHTHGYGSQLVGFYFLEVPENAPSALFYDTRIAKMPVDLPEKDPSTVSIASRIINFKPKPGLLIITNSWVAHSFGRNTSDKPFKFIHFNLAVQAAASMPCPVNNDVEIV